MARRKIKIGCIGLGGRGAGMYKMWIKNPDVIPYAVCDQNPEKLEQMKKTLEGEGLKDIKYFTTIDEFLKSDVEAVLVATDVATHSEISIQCLDAGKHVLCEIPNIASMEEAKKLNRAVKAHPELKFMVGENCCYWAFINTWKKLYEDGKLGDAVYAESDYIHYHDTPELQQYDDEGKPILNWRSYLTSMNYLTHNLGPLLYIMDDTCDEITGFFPDINPIEACHPAPPNGVLVIKTKKGALIKLFIGFGVPHMMRHNFALYGSKGSLEYRRRREEQGTLAFFADVPNCRSEIVIPVNDGYPGASQEGHGGCDPKLMEAFINCIIDDTKPPLDIEFGINIAIPGILAEESAKNGGKTIKMPDMSEFN